MDSSNLAVANSFTRVMASFRAYSLLLSTLPCRAFAFLVSLVITDPPPSRHGACGTSDGTNSGINAGSVHVLHLGLGDFFELSTSDLANLVAMRTSRALVQLDGLLDQSRRGRRLDDEGEALVSERGEDHGQRQTRLNTLGLGVERLAELHDVQAALTQCRADRGGRVGLASWHLQLHKTDDFFRHALLLAGQTPCRSSNQHMASRG